MMGQSMGHSVVTMVTHCHVQFQGLGMEPIIIKMGNSIKSNIDYMYNIHLEKTCTSDLK